MKPASHRRIVLIDPRFQLRMTTGFIALQVLLTAVFAFGLYMFMDSEIHADLASAHASYQSLSRMLLPIVLILAVFSVILSVVLITVFVILLSHKLAGPMYRFRAVLESLAQRRFATLTRIRQHDQFGEIAQSLGNAMNVVRTDVHALQHSLQKLRKCHEQGDGAGLMAEVSLMENTLNSWAADGPGGSADSGN